VCRLEQCSPAHSPLWTPTRTKRSPVGDRLRLKDRHDICALVTGLAAELARQNVRYADVIVTPYNHIRGYPATSC
jgi:hypothetical protein